MDKIKANLNTTSNDKIVVNFKDVSNDIIRINFQETDVDKIKIKFQETLRVNASFSLGYDNESGKLSLLGKDGATLSEIDLPIEKILTNVYYDDKTKELVLNFQNSKEVRIPIDFTDEIEKAISEFEIKINKAINGIEQDLESYKIENQKVLNSKVDKVQGKGLSTHDLTNELLEKLNSLNNYDDTNIQKQINDIKLILTTDDVDFDTLQELVNALKNNVSSISDIFQLLNRKVEKIEGKGLSTNDFTNEEKQKLAGLNNYDDTELRDKIDNTYTKDETQALINNVKPNINFKTLVGQDKEYNGTAVPNSGYVEKVYFNTSLNIDELIDIFSNLTYYQTPFLDNPLYPILFTTSGRVIFIEKSSSGNYTIINAGNVVDQTSGTIIFASKINNGKIEIASFDISECNINENVINEYSGLPIGAENSKLKSLVSTTPFEEETQLYELNADGTINKDKPINLGVNDEKIDLTDYYTKSEIDDSFSIRDTNISNAQTSSTNALNKANQNETNILSLDEEKEDKANLVITTEVGTSQAIGGIPKGTVLKGKTVRDVIEEMLFPYIKFSMNVQSVSPTGTYEKGTSVTLTSVTVRITAGTKPVTNIKLYESNKTTLLGEKTSGIATDNTFSINKTVSSSVSFYATATDGVSNVSDSSSFLAFYDPTFYGVLDVGYTLSSDLITGKSKELKANKSNTRTYNATNQHPFLAYPSSYGTLTSIKDGNGFECIGDFNTSTLNLTVKSGTVSYRVYVLKSATTGTGYKYIFS